MQHDLGHQLREEAVGRQTGRVGAISDTGNLVRIAHRRPPVDEKKMKRLTPAP